MFRNIRYGVGICLCTLISSAVFAEEPSTKQLNDILVRLSNQIIKEGGYVHPSLQLASPAPCGADRGVIGADTDATGGRASSDEDNDSTIWLRVPFSYQITRNLALETITPLIPDDVLSMAPLQTLDDAALLVLLHVHLRGASSKKDKWYPFLTSLPDSPGCGWWSDDEDDSIKKIKVYEHIISNDVVVGSRQYVGRVSTGMDGDYGHYLAKKYWPKKWNGEAASAIEWALCIVSSRGTAASPSLGGGSTRLVPFADMFNHNLQSDGVFEIDENEINSEAGESLLGSFEIRRRTGIDGSLPGEEITVNYSLWGYSPEDWFLSHGFVPPEVLERIPRSEL